MPEPAQPAPRRLAAGYALTLCGFGVLFVLWTRGLLRPLLPVLLIIALILVLRRVLKAITAPVD